MAVKLNERAFAQARELIVDRRIVLDERDDWSAHQPSARDVTLFIAAHGWDAYGRWFLGVDDAHPARSKPHYRFPYGDFRDVHRCAVLTAEHHDAIRGAARFLYHLLEVARAKSTS
jgi:hypothetical protein